MESRTVSEDYQLIWGEAGTSQAVSDGFFPEGTNVSPLPISVPTPSIST